MSGKQKAQRGTLKKVLAYLKPYRMLVALSVLLSAVTVALTLYVPVLIGRAIDGIVGPGQVDFANVLSLLTRIGVIVGIIGLAGTLYAWPLYQKVLAKQRKKAAPEILRLSENE